MIHVLLKLGMISGAGCRLLDPSHLSSIPTEPATRNAALIVSRPRDEIPIPTRSSTRKYNTIPASITNVRARDTRRLTEAAQFATIIMAGQTRGERERLRGICTRLTEAVQHPQLPSWLGRRGRERERLIENCTTWKRSPILYTSVGIGTRLRSNGRITMAAYKDKNTTICKFLHIRCILDVH